MSENESFSSYQLMRERFPKDWDSIQRRLEAMRDYCRQLDVLAVCFHGTSQSGALVGVLEDEKSFGRGLKADNTGIDFLDRQVGVLTRRPWTREQEAQFIRDLADALASARRLALFVDASGVSRGFQRELVTALLQAAESKGAGVYLMSQSGEYKRLLRDLQAAYPVK